MSRFRHLLRALAFAASLLLVLPVHALSVLPPTTDELVASADTIVRGVVTDIRTEEFDSPQGRGIRTLVTLRVERTLKGRTGETLTLSLLGGKVGRRTLRVIGMPEFQIGAREVVFVSGNGTTMCPLVSAGHGRYHVRHDAATQRTYIARDNGVPLESTEDISFPLGAGAAALARIKSPARALALDDFESKIAAVINQQGQRIREP
jgi:hypothetical protein